MVSEDEICKVGDFGLLREIPKDADIYVSQTKTKFPIRWMAPESLMKKEFSPASDVWSFGVIMWEMYNPSELPYKGLDNLQVAVGVNQDLRLHIPEIYPHTVARVMKACWQQSPSKRPSFLLIASLLSSVYFGAE
jgi:serine/threonine protein kinase